MADAMEVKSAASEDMGGPFFLSRARPGTPACLRT